MRLSICTGLILDLSSFHNIVSPEDGREWRLPGLLYADDLVLCGELEEDLRVMVGQFTEVCRRRGLKVHAGKSKVMVLNGEETEK